jgi:hypothetical protein
MVHKTNNRYLSGGVLHINKNNKVKDENGKTFQVNKDVTRYLSGELVSICKNKIIVKDINGNKFSVDKMIKIFIRRICWYRGKK